MSWEKEIEELKKRENLAEKMGGKEKLQRQKDNKRLNVRERIKLLLDKDSFHEIGKIAGKAKYDEDGNLKDFLCAQHLYIELIVHLEAYKPYSHYLYLKHLLLHLKLPILGDLILLL